MRQQLSDHQCLSGLIKLAREYPQYEDILCSSISFIAQIVFDHDERDRVCRETFTAHGEPRPLDLNARPVDRNFYEEWIRRQGGLK